MKNKEYIENQYKELLEQNEGKKVLNLVEFIKLRNFKSQIQVETNEELIKEKTKEALEKAKSDNSEDIKESLRLLCSLKGIGIPTASTILHFAYPNKYAIIDIYCWNRIKEYSMNDLASSYGEGEKGYENYSIYLKLLTKLKEETGKTFRQIESEWFYEERDKNIKSKRRV